MATYIDEQVVPLGDVVVGEPGRPVVKAEVAPELGRLLVLSHKFDQTASFLVRLHQFEVIHRCCSVSLLICWEYFVADPKPCACLGQDDEDSSRVKDFAMACGSFVTLDVQVFHHQSGDDEVRVFNLMRANQKHSWVYRQSIVVLVKPFVEPY
jgi:hypothetical protein